MCIGDLDSLLCISSSVINFGFSGLKVLILGVNPLSKCLLTGLPCLNMPLGYILLPMLFIVGMLNWLTLFPKMFAIRLRVSSSYGKKKSWVYVCILILTILAGAIVYDQLGVQITFGFSGRASDIFLSTTVISLFLIALIWSNIFFKFLWLHESSFSFVSSSLWDILGASSSTCISSVTTEVYWIST